MNFTGFPEAGLTFLRDLAANNDPLWFKPRRDDYEALVRGPVIALVADLLTLAAARKLPLSGEPAKAVFRIHRDVRFAKDKHPYKTHCGASLSRTGSWHRDCSTSISNRAAASSPPGSGIRSHRY
jgi:uncharacterized protein (TIGR02453 family)